MEYTIKTTLSNFKFQTLEVFLDFWIRQQPCDINNLNALYNFKHLKQNERVVCSTYSEWQGEIVEYVIVTNFARILKISPKCILNIEHNEHNYELDTDAIDGLTLFNRNMNHCENTAKKILFYIDDIIAYSPRVKRRKSEDGITKGIENIDLNEVHIDDVTEILASL